MDTTKVLAQAYPTLGTLTDAYTVPAGAKAVVSTLKACNQQCFETEFRVAIAIAGAAAERKQYLYYDVPLDANDTFSATEGWTLGAGDVIRVYSANGMVSFNIFGVEITS